MLPELPLHRRVSVHIRDFKAGRMKSVFILKTFAKHLKILEGSRIDQRRPFGALALSYAAVTWLPP